jgi:chemotaxis protein histidine kinase CheA
MDTQAIKKSLLKKFQEVTADRLQKIQLAVIQLEKPDSDGAADSVARELHTMKGEARMLGLAAVGQLAHAAEDLLNAALDGRAPSRAAADLLLRVCDLLSDLLDDLEVAHAGNEATEVMCRTLAQASGHPVPSLKPDHPARGNHKPDGSSRGQPRESHVGRARSPAAEPAADAPKAPNADRTIRVNVEILDALGLMAGDLLVESARARLRASELNGILQRFSRISDRFLRLGDAHGSAPGDRNPLEQLESDLHLLRDDAFRFIRRNADGLNVLHGNLAKLADGVAEARLVPLSTVFEAFPRAVRDIASQQGKQVNLSVENAHLGLDRSMVSDLRDALVHLLRNAIDHGIEGPDIREQLGKPADGQVAVRVRADGDMLHLEVTDDGRGIDPDVLRQSAVAKGILGSQQAAAMSERELMGLVFLSGFSTRQEVSDISGRGMGMNVVKQKVELLGGSVTIQAQVGRGTRVLLRVPQSLALLRVLLVRLGDGVYGIPAADVEAVVRVKPQDCLEIFGMVAIRHRGRPVTLIALGPLLGLNGGPRHDRPTAVVVRQGEDRAALVVDGLLDEREVAVKPCGGEFLKGAPLVAGTAAMEDGRVGVLLQLRDIMAEVRRHSRSSAPALAAKRLRLLIVDDSPIARATACALVKALGHSIDEAQDGEEALLKVSAQSFDAVLTDVQMPKLDGFALTRRLKSSAATTSLPVVILSSLTSPEDKRRGADAGADAYLIKGELGLESLAEVLDRLT